MITLKYELFVLDPDDYPIIDVPYGVVISDVSDALVGKLEHLWAVADNNIGDNIEVIEIPDYMFNIEYNWEAPNVYQHHYTKRPDGVWYHLIRTIPRQDLSWAEENELYQTWVANDKKMWMAFEVLAL